MARAYSLYRGMYLLSYGLICIAVPYYNAINIRIVSTEISFVSQQESSVSRIEEWRLESGYPLGASAIALIQVRNVECLI